ncbi:hypothetical protein ACFQX7_05730 [Luedemannella flava]
MSAYSARRRGSHANRRPGRHAPGPALRPGRPALDADTGAFERVPGRRTAIVGVGLLVTSGAVGTFLAAISLAATRTDDPSEQSLPHDPAVGRRARRRGRAADRRPGVGQPARAPDADHTTAVVERDRAGRPGARDSHGDAVRDQQPATAQPGPGAGARFAGILLPDVRRRPWPPWRAAPQRRRRGPRPRARRPARPRRMPTLRTARPRRRGSG